MVWSLLSILHYVSMPEKKREQKKRRFSFSQEKKERKEVNSITKFKWIEKWYTATASWIELNPSIPAKICDRAENQQLEMKLVELQSDKAQWSNVDKNRVH